MLMYVRIFGCIYIHVRIYMYVFISIQPLVYSLTYQSINLIFLSVYLYLSIKLLFAPIFLSICNLSIYLRASTYGHIYIHIPIFTHSCKHTYMKPVYIHIDWGNHNTCVFSFSFLFLIYFFSLFNFFNFFIFLFL